MKNFRFLKISLMTLVVLIFYASQISAQIQGHSHTHKDGKEHNCGHTHMIKKLLDERPEFRKKYEEAISRRTNSKSVVRQMTGSIVPVVYHIVQPCDDQYDFTLAELDLPLEEVNIDFESSDDSEYNCSIDPIHCNIRSSDIGLDFVRATVDPDGNPTTGVTRTNSFYSNDGGEYQYDLKDIIQWDPAKYLNIWIVKKVNKGFASAYAHFPATAEAYPYLDGIVIDHTYLGAENPHVETNYRPNTLTHEIGHWLDLQHTWGPSNFWGEATNCSEDDGVDDTPNCIGIIHCPATPTNTCNDGAGDLPDNIHNFMDYSCQTMFTEDQNARMWDAINMGLANRDDCVTDFTDTQVFQDNHPDVNDAKLYTDRMVYTESFDNPGTIEDVGIITLEDCAGCSFSNNINNAYSVTGLPSNIANAMTITKINATTASVSFNLNLTNPDDHLPDADLEFDINFTPGAINGISNSNSVFNSNSIKGLKVDFIETASDLYFTNTVYNAEINGDDYTIVFMPILQQEIGFYNQDGVFRFYTSNSYTSEVAIDNGINLVKRLDANTVIADQTFTSLPGYGMEFSNDWDGNTGFVGIKILGLCGQVFYVSIELDFTGPTPTIINLVITTDDSLVSGELPDCVPVAENSNYTYIDNVEIGDIQNQSGNNGGYTFFNAHTTDLLEGETYDVLCESNGAYDGEWWIYIDLNGNGSYLDEGELRFTQDDLFHVDQAMELVPAGTLNGVSELNTTMLIFNSLHPFGPHGICNPDPYQYGEVEEYNVTIKSTGCAPPAPCIPMGCDQNYLFINQVQLEDIDNTSGNNGGYAFFNTPTTELTEGAMVNLQCTNGGWYANTNYSYWNVYVDLNADGDYLDPSETRYLATQINDVDVTMELIPDGTLNGASQLETTMMVVLSVHPIVDICQVFQYGEVEEYNITINGACATPPVSDIYRSLWCNNNMILKTHNYVGVLHQYRYSVQGTNSWTSTYPTTSKNTNLGIMPECTMYEVQLRVYCADTYTWSSWSGSKNFLTRPKRAIASNILSANGNTWAYLILINHTGDQKLFRYREVGGPWVNLPSTTSHYVFVNNLTPDTDYQFQVRQRCGTTGFFSCYSAVNTFTTTSGAALIVGDVPEESLTAINRELLDEDLKVYPNPISGDFLNVELGSSDREGLKSLRVTSATGQVLWSKEYDGERSAKVPMQNLSSGIYFININGFVTKRVIRTQ